MAVTVRDGWSSEFPQVYCSDSYTGTYLGTHLYQIKSPNDVDSIFLRNVGKNLTPRMRQSVPLKISEQIQYPPRHNKPKYHII